MSAAENASRKEYEYESPKILASYSIDELVREAAVCHHYSWHQTHKGGNGGGSHGGGKGKGK